MTNHPNRSRIAADLKEVRRALADYMQSEGCSCCRNAEAHERNAERLALLLKVPRYGDGSGYNFSKFQTNKAGAQ